MAFVDAMVGSQQAKLCVSVQHCVTPVAVQASPVVRAGQL